MLKCDCMLQIVIMRDHSVSSHSYKKPMGCIDFSRANAKLSVETIVSDRDSFVFLPTGYGK